MSLIQVSSSQIAFKQQGIGQGVFNTGFRFSNFFNNVLEIPANAEIALHSAQFDMENTGGIDTTFIGSDNDLNVPCMRILYALAVQDFATQNDNTLVRASNLIPIQVPVTATHLPLVAYMLRNKYKTMEHFWDDWVSVMRTESRPQFQNKVDAAGVQLAGWGATYSAPAGVETETFATISNVLSSSVPNRRNLTSSAWSQGGGCGFASPPLSYSTATSGEANTCELTNPVLAGEFRDVTKTSGGTIERAAHAPFWTQFEGLNNAGGVMTCRGFDCPAIADGAQNPPQGQGRRHVYSWGLKRWGVVEESASLGDPTRTNAVQRLALAANANLHRKIASQANTNWGSAGVAATLNQYYYSAALVSSGSDGLSFQPDCVSDVFWVISPRIANISGVTHRVTAYGTEMVVSLWKYECGTGTGLALGTQMNRVVCVATGDALASTTFDVCYSGQLDPTNISFPAGQVLSNQNATPPLTNGIGLGFTLNGNQVAPFISPASVLNFAKSPVAWVAGDTTQVFIPLTDVVYPIQVCGSMNGKNDAITAIAINPAGALDGGINYQSPVYNLGDGYDDFFKYVRQVRICPASIYNGTFLDQTCETLYPLDANVATPQSVTPYAFYDNLIPIPLTTDNSVNISAFVGVGFEPLLDVSPAYTNEYANNANMTDLIRWDTSTTPHNILTITPDATWEVGNGKYAIQATGTAPFLLGLYVKLKNLPNRSTFGSLNQADCEKLISVINRYDERESSAGDKTMYAYNEYDKLYISLNNPATLYLSKLDFEIVDRFGNAVTSLDQTTLVLHLRPGEYKDFYKR